MAGLSALPGASVARTPHAGSPAPCLSFAPVRGPAGDVLDFQCTSLNAAAGDVVRDWGLEPLLSAWPAGGVSGLEVADCVHLGSTGVPLSVALRVRREGLEARFQAVAVPQGEGFALWLLPPVEEDTRGLREMLERLAEEARLRERFIGILGHDLRNPLSAISLSARAMRRHSTHGSNLQQLAQRIETSAARMGTMISDILDLTRARLSGGIPLNLAPVNLTAVCRQVVEELTAAWPERYIAFDDDGRADGVWDAERLAQVLSNLVGNALEHGAPDAPVILRCMEQDGWQVLEVHNPGAPIPVTQLATLFDPFRQAATAREKGRRRGGLGLGLFIVREIVQAHGGRVHVSSSEHDGTTFTVSLPRDARSARAATVASAPRNG